MEENLQNNNTHMEESRLNNQRKPWYHAIDFPELKAQMAPEDISFFQQALTKDDRSPEAKKRMAAIALGALNDAAAHRPGKRLTGTPAKPINLRVTCPLCKKPHCDILVSNGAYHCWTCQEVSGQLPELRQQPEKSSNAVGARYYAHANTLSKRQGQDYVPMIPSDYKEIPEDVRSWLYPVYPYQSAEEQAQFIAHFHPQGLAARCRKARLPLPPHQLLSLQQQVQAYCQAMRLSPDVIRQEGVMCAYLPIKSQDQAREDPQGTELVPAIAYCNRVMGRIVNVKFRSVSRHPITGEWSKTFMQQSPTTPCAHYGIDSINPLRPGAEPIPLLIFTEGEKDRLTLMSCGYPHVLSVANGASTDLDRSGEAFNDWILQAEEIIVCGDTDQPGRKLVKMLLHKYGDRAKVVQLPEGAKDISEVMHAYGPEEVRRIIGEARDLQSNFEYSFEDHEDDIIRVMTGQYDHGYSIGMGERTDRIFHPTSAGGLMIVTGIPNSGKTDFLNCMMTHIMFHCHKRVGFLSFELPIKEKHIRTIARIALGVADLEHDLKQPDGSVDSRKVELVVRPTIQYLSRHMIDFQTDNARPTPQLIIQIAEKHRKRHGLDYLVIDPYLFIDMDEGRQKSTETELVKAMLTLIQTWSRKRGVWTIIVAHPRIQHKEVTRDFDSLNFYDISGSAQWANLADFILAVRRVNKPEEHKVYTAVKMLKIRDQEFCQPGEVFYTRQPCGRYDEREDEQACISEHSHAAVLPQDIDVWTGE